MKKLICLLFSSIALLSISHAQLEILPDIDSSSGPELEKIIDNVTSTGGGNTIDNYYREANKLDKQGRVGEQLASGVMTRNTILKYAAYVVRFISQLGLLIGAMMIIRAGYEYATQVFTGNTGSGSKRIKNAIIGVIIIIFSYAIMRIITTAFLT